MGSTNKTANLELSQFLGSDSPKWLTDYNADMQKIDGGYSTVKSQADATDLVVSGQATTLTNLSATVSDQGTSIQSLRTDTTTNTGSINTINSLIGNGTPTTTDQTIIGAINELHAEIGGGTTISVDADEVVYDNTTSGLSATNAQAAIDEVAAAIPVSMDAEDIVYDNTTSGLSATNAQAAIDELAAGGSTDSGFGSAVTISSYNTYAGAYVCPSDGYISGQMNGTSATGNSISVRVYGSNSTADTDPHFGVHVDGQYDSFAFFVRKGMKVYISNIAQGTVTFIPFV